MSPYLTGFKYGIFDIICLFLLCLVSYVQSSSDGMCEICPKNTFCHNTGIYACPLNQISDPGSNVNTDCTCKPGYYGAAGEGCAKCLSG